MMGALDGLQLWLAAVRWRRLVERELRTIGLTLTQWIALDAAAALIREHRDAVSQVEVCRRSEMDQSTMSNVMMRLSLGGFVDRDIDFTGTTYRIYVTEVGERALAVGAGIIRRTRVER